jgi:hypothetical protein
MIQVIEPDPTLGPAEPLIPPRGGQSENPIANFLSRKSLNSLNQAAKMFGASERAH